ncbi:MAG TPA: M48 family metallopeptidase [Candidatus Angelobacter sp.]
MLLRNLLAVILLCLPAAAQTVPQQPHTQPTVTAKQTTEYTLPPDKLRQAEALYKLEIKLGIFGLIYSWAVLLAVLYWGIGARFRNWAERVSCYRWVQALIFVPLLMITLVMAALPLRIYGHHVSLQYGLSVQNWASWFGDWGKGLALTLAIYTFLLFLLRVFIRRSPRRWWFYYWAIVGVPLIIFSFYITPLVIDPLFNKFEPLEAKNPQLVDAIEKVTQRGGLEIPRSRMFEMKASEKVTTLNAYVTGFGSSKRVVVWDTTIQKLTTAETLFVFGHEMGHYVLHHIIYGLIGACIGLLVLLYIIYRMSPGILRRFGGRWQIRALHDWAAMPMIFLLAGILLFLGEPVGNAVSRYTEHQADIYGLEVTHGINPNSQQVAAHSFQLLGEVSLDYPWPNHLAVFWYWTHPPIADRVRFAHDYDPWDKGEKPKYVE